MRVCRAAQGPPASCAAAPRAGFPPRIRRVTIRIGLRLAATNLAPCYVLRRRPSPVVHCCRSLPPPRPRSHAVARAAGATDPAAGSPTAALLRLLLPPDGQARGAFLAVRAARQSVQVGRSDGRCVQKTGTQSARGHHARLLDIPRSRGTVPTPGPYHGGASRVAARLRAAPRCGRQCSTRAAQSVEGHHRPASATALVRLGAGAPAAGCGGGLAR